MIERLVFVATMFTLLIVGVNGFLLMGNSLVMTDGSPINLMGNTNNALDYNNVASQAQQVQFNPSAGTGASTSTPGSAQSINSVSYQGQAPGFYGLDLMKTAVFGTQFAALRLAGIYPFASPLIYIFVTIAFMLQAFVFMYWGMAGARAFFGRFL